MDINPPYIYFANSELFSYIQSMKMEFNNEMASQYQSMQTRNSKFNQENINIQDQKE